MFCTNCGAQISDDAVFCPFCGEKTGEKTGYGQNIIQDVRRTDPYATNSYTSNSYGTNPYPGVRQKSRNVAMVLALFLGGIGGHNFYLGYTGKAIWQLVLGILSGGLISGIWALVDLIMLLTGKIYLDGSGIPLK